MDPWTLIDRYQQRIRNFILVVVRDPWITDELTQDTFVCAMGRMDSLRDLHKLESWRFKIAHNLCHDNFRTLIWLFDGQGFSIKETADILGITVTNTKVRLHRARRQLKSILEGNCRLDRDERDVLVCRPNLEGSYIWSSPGFRHEG
jgi:RNA polymerase sigma-70 factor (ECF subfamily)